VANPCASLFAAPPRTRWQHTATRRGYPSGLIITQTPFRISFFGGGTDYPDYIDRHGGAVLGTAIDKSAYLSVSHFFSRLFDYSIRIAYRQVECVRTVAEIQHAPFRECLKYCGISSDVEVNYTGELPSFSGLGSSSSFVVGLLNALHAFQHRSVRPLDLALQAMEIEQDILKESVGCQDQTFAAVGGFNVVEFRGRRDLVVHRIPLSADRLRDVEAHLLVLHTGIKRHAEVAAASQVKRIEDNNERLHRMRAMVDEGYQILTGGASLESFGRLLHESWCLKSSLDDSIANDNIRQTYATGLAAGAFGGKLLGAGGGGCILFFVPPERRQAVRASLAHLQEIPVAINAPGSRIVHA
jgi:D-glycero-alpha-D-manno-heptose-7-phosphate kinase